MLRRLTCWLPLTLLLAAGCGSAAVEYPANPTPPPTADPVSTSTPAADPG